AEAAVVEHEHAIAAGRDRIDLEREIGGRNAFGGEIKDRGLAAPRRQIPGDQLDAAPALEGDLFHLGKADILRRVALLVGHIQKVAMKHPGAETYQRVGTKK